ncbi:YqcC family protein [Pseudomonas aeruginosa]|uniref:YqcC family protein n=1 Tax=Pseudomonas aeruginosa TaxID=287 RepID=UPI001067B0F2|nr:YqcC family protein [Pseudomonas aeruginosa]TEC96011.1 YqcC family protein [Pseudomonas aeruginosa]
MDRRVYALADQLLLIERELRALGWWSESSPAPEALASPEPFCVDTLALEQWLQWIFLPRMKLILESDSALPQASGILARAEVAYAQRGEEVAGLLAALGEFDRLIGGPS